MAASLDPAELQTRLGGIPVRDLRDRMLLDPTRTAAARDTTTAVTWHYNGDPVSALRQRDAGLVAWLRILAAVHRDKPTIRGDGLQYHLVVCGRGEVHLCRDLSTRLSHCGGRIGNSDERGAGALRLGHQLQHRCRNDSQRSFGTHQQML